MRWLDGIINSVDEFEQGLGDGEGQGSLVCCNSWGHRFGYDLVSEQQQPEHNLICVYSFRY